MLVTVGASAFSPPQRSPSRPERRVPSATGPALPRPAQASRLQSGAVGSDAASQAITIAASVLTGLLVGSFLNVVVYRVPRRMSIVQPPSHCPACNTRLGALELVPVLSWIALRGHCRHCGAPVSLRYPLVELTTGAAFGAVAAAVGTIRPLPSIAVLTACVIGVAIMDADGSALPAPLAVISALAAASLTAVSLATGHPLELGWAALGGFLAGTSMVIADRPAHSGRWSRATVVAALGWTAGWLWPPGGALVAGWVVVAAAGSRAGAHRAPLAILTAGGFAMVLAAGALARA